MVKHLFGIAMTAGMAVLFTAAGSYGQQKDLGFRWILVADVPVDEFEISATEVTFDQYDAFCAATEREKPEAPFGRGKQPVVNVSYGDATEFCEWLGGQIGATVRLPNASEWVLAARGGKLHAGHIFPGSDEADPVAWIADNAGGKAHAVATKKPNELGIYDMAGNVWEWCDTYSIRSGGNWAYGGSWDMYDLQCRIPTRIVVQEEYKGANLGFRVLREK
jgi:formylglycine-generating enzyme required for sulfatase activity